MRKVILLVAWLLLPLLASQPPSMTRPEPGQVVVDPVFGTKIVRVSSPAEGKVCTTNYSIWSPFNSNSTKLLMLCWSDQSGSDPTQWLVTLNAEGIPTSKEDITLLHFDIGAGAEWDRENPNVLYYMGLPASIWQYDFSRNEKKRLKDLTSVTPNMFRLTMADDNDTFCAEKRDANYATMGVFCWRRSTDTILVDLPKSEVGEKPSVDNTGEWVMAYGNASGEDCVVNTRSGTINCKPNNATYRTGGHGDLGRGTSVHWEGWDSSIILQMFPNFSTWRVLLPFRRFGFEFHGSLTSRTATELLGGTSPSCPGGAATWDYSNELFLVPLDGSSVKRLAHTRANPCMDWGQSYWLTVRPSLSQDGHFGVFTSNWFPEESWREVADVYLAVLQPSEAEPTFVWTAVDPLPAWVTLSSSGTLTVNPQNAVTGDYQFRIKVEMSDGSAEPAVQLFTLHVDPKEEPPPPPKKIAITTSPTLPSCKVGDAPYVIQLEGEII